MQKLNIQDFFRSQLSSLVEQQLDFGTAAAKESCSVFATAYNEDAHMTRIYCCRPLTNQEHTNNPQE
jgi:hypothetical protein